MACAGAQSGMNVVILQHMPDIFHSPRPAPLTNVIAEIFTIELAHCIHIMITDG
ncbi:hypothetical protein D3C72_2239760 [compost metagenome]